MIVIHGNREYLFICMEFIFHMEFSLFLVTFYIVLSCESHFCAFTREMNAFNKIYTKQVELRIYRNGAGKLNGYELRMGQTRLFHWTQRTMYCMEWILWQMTLWQSDWVLHIHNDTQKVKQYKLKRITKFPFCIGWNGIVIFNSRISNMSRNSAVRCSRVQTHFIYTQCGC